MTSIRTKIAICAAARALLVAAAVALAAPARAQTPPPRPPAQAELGGEQTARPWAKGVSAQNQKTAVELFREGNGLLKESLFVQAAEKYREALRYWDHPGIHFNLALALLNLDQPVEVFRQLEQAMKYGPAPLDADKFEHAGRYKALIEKQLARVEVRCDSPGASVTLDGRPLFTAPGRYEGLVRAGQHTIVATRSGFVTTQKTPILAAGLRAQIDLPLYTAEELTHYRRRWSAWIPWTVLGAGVALAGAGGIMHWRAAEAYRQFDRGVTTCSQGSANGGCVPDGALAGKRATADDLQVGAFVGYGLGGAALAAGAVLAYLNRARPYRVSPDADKLALAPLVNPNGGGLVATIRF